jgi:hypothetical protein
MDHLSYSNDVGAHLLTTQSPRALQQKLLNDQRTFDGRKILLISNLRGHKIYVNTLGRYFSVSESGFAIHSCIHLSR